MLYTINETRQALKSGTTTSAALVQASIDTFEKDKSAPIPLNAFIEMYDDAAQKAAEADKEIAAARSQGAAALDKLFAEKPLLGIPFANKDNINSKSLSKVPASRAAAISLSAWAAFCAASSYISMNALRGIGADLSFSKVSIASRTSFSLVVSPFLRACLVSAIVYNIIVFLLVYAAR